MAGQKYNITIKRKYIYITPTPKENIKKGLWAELDEPPKEYNTAIVYTDIIKGQNRYEKPNFGKVLRVWINYKPKSKKP